MKKDNGLFFMALLIFGLSFLSGCASLEHNKSHFKATTEDGLVVAEDEKNAYTLTIFPSTEKVQSVSGAYSGAASTNNGFHLQNEAQKYRFTMQPQSSASSYLPEANGGQVIYRQSSPDADSVVFVNDSKNYDVQVTSGPFADGVPLSPGMSSSPVSKNGLAEKNGLINIHYKWMNKNSGEQGEKNAWYQIRPDTVIILLSKKSNY